MHQRRYREIPFGQRIRNGPTGSILCNLFRGLLASADVDQESYSRVIDRYAQNPPEGANASTIQSLGKELMRESITWKAFLKGLDFLRVGKFSFIVQLELEDGRSVRYNATHQLNQIPAPGNVLSTAFRELSLSIVSDVKEHSELMNRYIERNCVGSDRTRRAAVRSTLGKELFKAAMTWKSFIKGMVYLSATKIEITFIAYPQRAGTLSSYSARESVNLGDFKDIGDEE